MNDLDSIERAVARLQSLDSAKAFFEDLGYPTLAPLPEDLSRLPGGARDSVSSVHRLANLTDGSPLRIFHVKLKHSTIRRTDIRRFLEAFYRHYPQGENLFVFAPPSYDEIAFVSPRRLPDPRDSTKIRLWLRILPVRRERPYRTDLEVLSRIRTDGVLDPQELWRRHDGAFSVQRVTEQFFRDYAEVFELIRTPLRKTHRDNSPEWARDYAHQLLNRIMFLYFVARKGWLHGPDGRPDRDFMRHFWEAFRDSTEKNAFHSEWLRVLFFEAFNNRWQNRPKYLKRFPRWLINALAQAPFLNGGLYTKRRDLDDRLQEYLPDAIFELIFEKWTDGTFPGLFERYNFTVVESGRFDEEVAVDPEMLGIVYERLVNITFESGEDDLRGTAGIFYTPRTEIDLMCRLALVDRLANQLRGRHKNLFYDWVFAFGEEEKQDADAEVTKADLWNPLNELVRRVRVCDPACGSGAFLVGMMLVLDDLQARCNASLGTDEPPYERRKRILRDQLYGVDVMEWAVRVAELRLWLQLVVDNQAKRSFAQADVNTVIVLAGRPEQRGPLPEKEMKSRQVRFVAFRVPFEEAISPVIFSEIEDENLYKPFAGFLVLKRPEFRCVLRDQWGLWREGAAGDDSSRLLDPGQYEGNKWGGKYLRAPDIYFTILEKGKGKLVRLGDIAEVRFGIKTGANEFFYLEPVDHTVKEIAQLVGAHGRAPLRAQVKRKTPQTGWGAHGRAPLRVRVRRAMR